MTGKLLHSEMLGNLNLNSRFIASRYVHSPIGLPIPNRNGGVGMLGYPSIKQEVGNSSSPAGGMWGGPSQMQRTMNSVPFPVTPFNTPSQGQSVFMGPDLRNFFLSGTSNNHHQHLNSVSNPTLSVSIKEELTDLETDLETMKVCIPLLN